MTENNEMEQGAQEQGIKWASVADLLETHIGTKKAFTKWMNSEIRVGMPLQGAFKTADLWAVLGASFTAVKANESLMCFGGNLATATVMRNSADLILSVKRLYERAKAEQEAGRLPMSAYAYTTKAGHIRLRRDALTIARVPVGYVDNPVYDRLTATAQGADWVRQTADEVHFFPLSAERGRVRAWNICALSYALFVPDALRDAHRRRLSLFRSEGGGYARALSMPHNRARFRFSGAWLPPRERGQEWRRRATLTITAQRNADLDEQGRRLKVALRYGRRYGTTTARTLMDAMGAGIRLRTDSRTAENIRQAYGAFCAYLDQVGKGQGATETGQQGNRQGEQGLYPIRSGNAKIGVGAQGAGAQGGTTLTHGVGGTPAPKRVCRGAMTDKDTGYDERPAQTA